MSERWKVAGDYTRVFESKKWSDKIPYISFPSDWEVKITPNYSCSIIRFLVRKDNSSVSIYLDCYEELGFFGEPYWEIYPYFDDTYRCKMNDVSDLISKINDSLKNQSKESE